MSLRSSEHQEIMRTIEQEAQRAPASDVPWPDPAPLGDELLPVPAFELELLPPSLRPLIQDISERMQAPTDYAAAATIVALAGCVSRRALIIPKREDTSWCVVPNLWGAIVAPPGMMKSPILRAVTLPLARIEEKWRAEFESACSDFGIEKEQAELRWQAWREEYKRAVKKGETAPVQPDRTLREPMQRRLVLTDCTFEKLHEILAQNPAGVLVIRDELTGWLSQLDRLGREGERAFFLQAWNGDGGFTIDRIGRGSIHVPAICVSLLGNIQPARLRCYLSDALEGGPGDDGLFQRFQVLVWPDPPREWQLVDRPANQAALQTAERVFSTLTELPADDPVRMCFAPDAQQLFFDWWTELEQKVRGDSGLAPAFIAHLAKYRSLMPSLAGLFELADRAAAGNAFGAEISISLQHAQRAAATCEYLEAHARRVYACVISPETRSARELARHIQGGDLSSPFTTAPPISKVGLLSTLLSAFAEPSPCSKKPDGCGEQNRHHRQVGGDRLRLGWSTRRWSLVKSKWLDWTPSSEIIEKTIDPDPTKPTEPGSVGFVGGCPGVFSMTCLCDSSATPCRLPVSDPYAERMRTALRQINPPDYAAGMIPWLDKAHSELYTELISRLPDEIQRLWSERAPLEKFEAALVCLVSCHRRASALYRAYLVSRGSENRTKS